MGVAHGQDGCLDIRRTLPPSVDLQRVKETWLGWVNEARTQAGVEPLTLSKYLSATAGNWSTFASERGSIDHKRYAGAPYYDYNGISNWFEKKGLTFERLNRVTYGESIGWGMYRCDSADCTDELISEIRSTFDFFVKEKNTGGPHYRMMVNPAYDFTGIGIGTNSRQGRYYLTAHYATKITSDPAPLCQ